MLASGSEFVDWRHWLLFASLPWVYPTQTQLLNLFYQYKKIDRNNSGFINKNAYLQVPLWFKIDKPTTPADVTQPHAFDRHIHLINFWYELFSSITPSLPNLSGRSVKTPSDSRLDYKTMVKNNSKI